MSTAVAFLSGKGGSGKTTLALSMADLLARCNVKTLLVDCDLSTNGATYFHESQLYDWNMSEPNKVHSFADVLSGVELSCEPTPLKIKDNLDFIPSVAEISDKCLSGGVMRLNMFSGDRIHWFFNWARDYYDAILLDCQAGYSEFLPMILPQMDANLFVLEADSISASAMRSLHLKVGNCFGRARLYQVFNKATSEEYDIYSKIVGTFFTNIGTLLFDWKIRQAFSRSQVPDLESTSADYGTSLCEICKIIFLDRTVQDGLDSFTARLRYQQLEGKREQVEKELHEVEEPPKTYFRFIMRLTFPIIFITILIVPSMSEPLNAFLTDLVNIFREQPSNSSNIPESLANIPVVLIFVIIVWLAVAICSMVMTIAEKRYNANKAQRTRLEYVHQLKKIDKELETLKEKLEKQERLQQRNVN